MGSINDAARAWLTGLWRLQTRRRYLVAHALMSGAALVMAFTPLLNLLGYEFSVVMAALAALIVGPVTFGDLAPRAPSRSSAAALGGEAQAPASATGQAAVSAEARAGSAVRTRDPAIAPRPPGPGATFARLTGYHLVLLAPPLLIITLNALRVQVCDYTGGLVIFAVLPVVAVLYATLTAMAVDGLVQGRRVWRQVLYAGLLLLSVLGGAAHLALEPPIVVVNPYVGYFAGSIYDEALAVPAPLLAYRLLEVALIAALVLGLEWAWRRRQGLAAPVGLRPALALAVAAVAIGHAQHAELGYSITRDEIEQALGARYETEHFIIHYPATRAWGERIERVAEDHEFRYWQLARWFKTDPAADGKLVSYIYPDREAKGRLMGARNTLVAKLWLGEMHILYDAYGDSIMKHELAHLFTAPFGAGPLRLSARWGLAPNMGLVEGVASAAQWRGDVLSPHGWSAALHAIGEAPPLERILGAGGFWTRHSRTVYTLTGSFVRWLIETRGVERFQRAYAEGDFAAAYEEPLATLVEQWRAFLETVPIGEAELAQARFRFDRPSIFGKVCARNLAERRRQAATLASAGRLEAAAALQAEVVRLDPDALDDQQALMGTLVEAERYEEAEAVAAALLAREGIGEVRQASVREAVGDMRWRRGDLEAAARAYEAVLAMPGLPSPQRRALEIKRAALDEPGVRDAVARYFLDEDADAVRKLAALYEARAAAPEVATIPYLLGLRLHASRAFAEAIEPLEAALRLGLPGQELAQRARFTLAEAHYFEDDWAQAERFFADLAAGALREGERAEAADWLERTRWRAARADVALPERGQRAAPGDPGRARAAAPSRPNAGAPSAALGRLEALDEAPAPLPPFTTPRSGACASRQRW